MKEKPLFTTSYNPLRREKLQSKEKPPMTIKERLKRLEKDVK